MSMLSYLKEVPIESISSEYNEELNIILKNGRYQLCTPRAIYSYEDKYDNFTEVFKTVNLDATNLTDILLLGFGLGSIPYMLEHKFGKRFSYTAVEIDEAVIHLASKYVIGELKSDIEIVQADAYNYAFLSSSKYDMICIDVFVDDKIPESFYEEEFLDAIDDILAPKGYVIFNHLALTTEDKKIATEYYEKIFKKIFPKATFLVTGGNMMMISDKYKRVSP